MCVVPEGRARSEDEESDFFEFIKRNTTDDRQRNFRDLAKGEKIPSRELWLDIDRTLCVDSRINLTKIS